MSEIPFTYQKWLEYFDKLKRLNSFDMEWYDSLCSGTFVGSDVVKTALQRQIVDTVNTMLDRSTKRFVANLNESIIFNEWNQIDLLFVRLKKEVKFFLFFEHLEFLPKEFKQELSDCVREKMSDFWTQMISFLYTQSLEYHNSDLEDALFLIKRVKIFE